MKGFIYGKKEGWTETKLINWKPVSLLPFYPCPNCNQTTLFIALIYFSMNVKEKEKGEDGILLNQWGFKIKGKKC
jgi:hypothetical protein